VTPNVVIEFDVTKYQKDNLDNQLEEAKDILAKQISIGK
jgi:hypothetical protein